MILPESPTSLLVREVWTLLNEIMLPLACLIALVYLPRLFRE